MTKSTETKKKARPPGRPPKGEFHDKRKTLSTRITAGLRDQLEEAATESGRSLSQEIELRLMQSFEKEESRWREFGDSRLFYLCRAFAMSIRLEEAKTKKSMFEDAETFMAASEAVDTTMWEQVRDNWPIYVKNLEAAERAAVRARRRSKKSEK